jgi:hypothetical protein
MPPTQRTLEEIVASLNSPKHNSPTYSNSQTPYYTPRNSFTPTPRAPTPTPYVTPRARMNTPMAQTVTRGQSRSVKRTRSTPAMAPIMASTPKMSTVQGQSSQSVQSVQSRSVKRRNMPTPSSPRATPRSSSPRATPRSTSPRATPRAQAAAKASAKPQQVIPPYVLGARKKNVKFENVMKARQAITYANT